jgi:hypothetical protein
MQFDMPGFEIRSQITLSAPATLTVSLAQKHQPVPPNPDGNTKNSGFESNAFVVRSFFLLVFPHARSLEGGVYRTSPLSHSSMTCSGSKRAHAHTLRVADVLLFAVRSFPLGLS